MIQDLKNDFKNDLCDTNILIILEFLGETRIILIIRIKRIGGRMQYIGIWILISIGISGTFAA